MFFGNFFTFLSGTITILNINEIIDFKITSLFDLVNFLRANYPIITLFINLFIFYYLLRRINTNLKFILVPLLLIFIPQAFGFLSNYIFFNEYDAQSLSTLISISSCIVNITNIYILRNSKFHNLIFILPIFALVMQIVLFFSNYSILEIQYGGFPIILKIGEETFNLYFNSNGLGRSAAIIYTIVVFYLFVCKKKLYKYILYIISLLVLFLILCLSGRFNLIGLLILNLIIFFYHKEIILKNWILTLFSLFIVFLASENYRNLKAKLIIAENKDHFFREFELKKYKSNNSLFRAPAKNTIQTNLELIIKRDNKFDNSFYDKLNNLSTGRLTKWYFIILNNERTTFGYGPNKDRYFFKETIKNKIGIDDKSLIGANDAASGILYQYISGGIIGVICFIIFGLLILNRLYKLSFNNLSYIEKTYISLFVFLSFRIFFENGYLIYGIDFLILLICIILIKPKKTNNIQKYTH